MQANKNDLHALHPENYWKQTFIRSCWYNIPLSLLQFTIEKL